MAQSAHTHGPAYPEEEVPLPTHTHKHTEYSVKNAYIRILYIKTEMLLLKKKRFGGSTHLSWDERLEEAVQKSE